MQDGFDRAVNNSRRIPLTIERDAWIHDLDGVHHNYEGLGDIYEFYGRMKYLAFQEKFSHLNEDQIVSMGKKSFRQHGDGLLIFLEHALEIGIAKQSSKFMFLEDLFRYFHKVKFEHATTEMLTPCVETNAGFNAMAGRVRHGMLTQGCLPNWGIPTLNAKKRFQFFERHACLDFHDVGYVTKKLSPIPLKMAIKALDTSPERVVFIEDSLDNLATAKKLDRNIMCVYVHNKKPLDALPDYVDLQVPDLKTLVQMGAKLHAKPSLDNKWAPHNG